MSTIRLDTFSLPREKSDFSFKPLEDIFMDIKDMALENPLAVRVKKVIGAFAIVLTMQVR